MKATTNTCKIQKLSRKVQEESVEEIETINVSLKILSMIQWKSCLSQWELSLLG